MFQENSTIPGFLQILIAILVLTLLSFAIYYLIYIGNKHIDQNRRININWKIFFRTLAVLFLLAIVVALFKAFPILGKTMSAILVSILLAYLINPLVNKLENSKIPRPIGTIIVYIVLVLFFVGIGFLVIPSLTEQITKFVKNLPGIVNQVLDWLGDQLESNNIDTTSFYKEAESMISEYIGLSSEKILDFSAKALGSLTGSIGWILSAILIPIITYFFVVDKDRIFDMIKKHYPKKAYKDSHELFIEIDKSMSDFVRGRILMAIFVGVVTMILLLLLDIEFAVVIGLITMVGDIIPYIGPFLGFLPAIIFSLIKSPMLAVWVGLAFLFIQWVENNILGPKLLGKSTGLHPLIILLSIIIGGGMFGVWGMIMSVPFVSLVVILGKFTKKKLE